MTAIHRDKLRTARVEHICDKCESIIQPGQTYIDSNVFVPAELKLYDEDGPDFHSYSFCERCVFVGEFDIWLTPEQALAKLNEDNPSYLRWEEGALVAELEYPERFSNQVWEVVLLPQSGLLEWHKVGAAPANE